MVLATLNFVSGCLYDVFQQLPNRTSLLGIRLLILRTCIHYLHRQIL